MSLPPKGLYIDDVRSKLKKLKGPKVNPELRESLYDQVRASTGEDAVRELRTEMERDRVFKDCKKSHEEKYLNDIYGYSVKGDAPARIAYNRKYSERFSRIRF